jgi:hypothetical protein
MIEVRREINSIRNGQWENKYKIVFKYQLKFYTSIKTETEKQKEIRQNSLIEDDCSGLTNIKRTVKDAVNNFMHINSNLGKITNSSETTTMMTFGELKLCCNYQRN